MIIEKMRAEQIDAVKELLDLCFGDSAWSLDALRSQLQKPVSRCYVAIEEESVIGFLAFEQVLDEGSIAELAVHPAYRRQGIARELIRSVLDNSIKEIFLEVRESNTPAIALYESLGFERIGTRKGYYDAPKENALVMRKKPLM